MLKQFLAGAIVTGALTSTGFLQAAPAEAFSLSISPQYGSTENTGSAASLGFNFSQVGANVLLDLTVSNTTNGTQGLGATQSTLVGVAFDLLSGVSVSSYNANGSGFTKLWSDSTATLNPANLFGTFDVGISPPRNSFAGGNPQQGLTAGNSTSVSFLLSGNSLNASNLGSAFLAGFQDGSLRAAGRFQQVNAGGGSDKVRAGVPTPPKPEQPPETPNPEKVPEPSAISALVLAGLVILKGRKRQNSVPSSL
ncbi:PEP-CTERM sorting domain-containing protein [Leptolyngbya sp. FACHB-261]|uniref:PEP-CTERM sorting domain-containing protein n=1 Tax=Leptolyngbya sp. FACHB-261 TaxID=2692806 RepID=UPI001683B6E8|nr:PEP-CTERM sorting domain-containing protein [Leptolyngbya sp. FACHB-261]MBD2099933.1 PEP-CTERM sorting domain-containing protein [Leptolyngbya sp. FACHB-261]